MAKKAYLKKQKKCNDVDVYDIQHLLNIYIYTYIYIYREREKATDREFTHLNCSLFAYGG